MPANPSTVRGLTAVGSALAAGALTLACLGGLSQAQTPAGAPAAPSASPPPAPRPPAGPPVDPLIHDAHFHHVRINARDPAADIEFYVTHFAGKEARYAGLQDAVWVQKSWLLFDKVKTAPSIKLNTAFWHMGWGTEEPKVEFKRQTELGSTFFTPLTDISINNGGTRDRFYYMYVQGPDRALIELNTASHHHFGHVHMFATDPIAAGDWYIKIFGATGRALSTETTPARTPRFGVNGNQIGPSSSLYLDNVNVILYPIEYAKHAYAADWVGINELQSPRGHVQDSIGVSVPNLGAALAKLKAAGVKVMEKPRVSAKGKLKSAFIEGPDHMAIELVEDHTEHPQLEDKP